MPNFVGRGAIKNIADKPMTVRRHRNKIDTFLARKLDDSIGGFSEGENRFAGKTFVAQLPPALFQISAVLFHFVALRQFELIKVSRHPAIGYVHQQKLGIR